MKQGWKLLKCSSAPARLSHVSVSDRPDTTQQQHYPTRAVSWPRLQSRNSRKCEIAYISNNKCEGLTFAWLNFEYFKMEYRFVSPITVAAWSKAWTVFAGSNAGIVGSNPTQDMDVYVRLFCVCVVLCIGSGLATGWFPFQGVLPTV
jgi:hypothetical protein